MMPMPEIIPMLRQLRLLGMTDALEIRNRQATEDQMAYMEFLSLLLQDEIARRAQRKMDRRLKKAGLDNQKTLETFDFSFNPIINKAQIMDLATCRFLMEKVCVLIVGPCGTGKSHIAQALGHCAIRRGHDVIFGNQSRLLRGLFAAKATGAYEKQLSVLSRVDLLIIDDFGLRPLEPPQDEHLHEIISERYERHSTIITSNLDLTEWQEAFPNKLLGAAAIDRIRHGAYRVVLDGESYRSPRPLPETSKKPLEKGGENY